MNKFPGLRAAIAWVTLTLWALAWWRPLALPDEGRYADIGRLMWLTGDGWAPRLNGIPFFHKPPLLHWLEAASLAVGGVHPWVSRWVPIVHAVLMVIVMAWATQRTWGPAIAWRAVLILGSSLAFLIGGQYINHDMLAACWISIAIWCFGLSFLHGARPQKSLAFWGFLACGMGVMSKGLIGLVCPGLVMVVWLSLTRQWRKAWHLPWFTGLLGLALITLPWFIGVEMRHPGVFQYLIVEQHFGRYTGGQFNNVLPSYSYLLIVCALLFPWTLMVYGTGMRQAWGNLRGVLKPAQPAMALLWVWWITILIFFSIPSSKLVGYILPVMPPLAVLAAEFWQRKWSARPWGPAVFAVLCGLNLLIAVGVNQYAGNYTLKRSSADVAQHLSCLMAPSDPVWVAGGYPYDLPYVANLAQPVWVVSDWAQNRKTAGDNWQREMFEGLAFDPKAADILRPLSDLDQSHTPDHWLVTPKEIASPSAHWKVVWQGQAWTLWQGADSAGESPQSPKTKV